MQPHNFQGQPDRIMDPRNMLSPSSYPHVGSYPQSVHHSAVGSISAKPIDGSLHISNKPSTGSEGYLERNESLQSLQNWAPQPMMLQPNIAQTPSRRTSRMGLAESSPTLSQHYLREDTLAGGVPKQNKGYGTPTKMNPQQTNPFAPLPYSNMLPPQQLFGPPNPYQQHQQQQQFMNMVAWMQMMQMQQQPQMQMPQMPGEAQQQNIQKFMKQVETYENIIQRMEKEKPQPSRLNQQPTMPSFTTGYQGHDLSGRQMPSSLEGTSFISLTEEKKDDRGMGYQAPTLPHTDRGAPATFQYDDSKEDPLDLYKANQGVNYGQTYESLSRARQTSPDQEINDLRPPTAQGNHPPQQEMLEKYDFKELREEQHQPAGPQSQNLGQKNAKQKTEMSSPRLSENSQAELAPRPENAFDEKPISKPMAFEDLLAQKMNEEGSLKAELPPKDVSKPKRQFLKRNSKKIVSKVPQNSKKYNYYLSHFTDEFGERRSERKKQKPRAGSMAGTTQFYRTEQDNLLDVEEEEEEVKKERTKREKVFLKRGGGTGGGKGGGGPQKKEEKKPHRAPGGGAKYNQREEEEEEDGYFYKKGWENEDRAQDIKKQKKKLNIFDEDSDEEEEFGEKRNETDPQLYQNRSDEDETGREEDDLRAASEEDVRGGVKTSSIVQSYYLDKTKKASEQKRAAAQKKSSSNKAEQVAVQAIRERMDELNIVLEEQKRRNQQLSKREIEMRREIEKLKKQRRDFEEFKRIQKEELETMKENEMKKIKKEKKLMERQAKTMATQPNRKEREEIEKLKKEVAKFQEDLKTKEHRHKLYVDRLKRQIDDLSIKNSELELEIQHLESLRNNGASTGTKQTREKVGNSQPLDNEPRYNFSGLTSEETAFMKTEMEAVKEQDSEEEDGQSARSATQYEEEEKQQHQEIDHYEEEQSDEEDEDQEKRREEEASNRAPKSSTGVNQSFEMVFPDRYHSMVGLNLMSENVGANGKVQRIYSNGKKEIMFNNGVRREIFPDGYTVVYFNNKDIKQTYPDGKVVYFFAEARTTQTTYTDNLQVFKFQNGQIEKHFPDGTKEINFPDGTIKCIFSDGEEESIFPDGTIQRIEKSGVKSIEYSNGQKDILQPDGIRIREFPDGRVRKTYPNGEVENTIKQDI